MNLIDFERFFSIKMKAISRTRVKKKIGRHGSHCFAPFLKRKTASCSASIYNTRFLISNSDTRLF